MGLSLRGIRKAHPEFLRVVVFAGKEWFVVGHYSSILWLSDGQTVCTVGESEVGR
jgi:hypothetical protein